MIPQCALCGSRHYAYQAHVFATNATNGATNKAAVEVEPANTEEGSGSATSGVVRTANRRERDAYNAYQREYMRQYRKNKKISHGAGKA